MSIRTYMHVCVYVHMHTLCLDGAVCRAAFRHLTLISPFPVTLQYTPAMTLATQQLAFYSVEGGGGGEMLIEREEGKLLIERRGKLLIERRGKLLIEGGRGQYYCSPISLGYILTPDTTLGTCTHTHAYVYVRIHKCMHVHTHTHTHQGFI